MIDTNIYTPGPATVQMFPRGIDAFRFGFHAGLGAVLGGGVAIGLVALVSRLIRLVLVALAA